MSEEVASNATRGAFTRRVFVTGVALTLLFTFMAPQSSEPLRFFPRLMFWSLHIGLGLLAAHVAARGVLVWAPRVRDWRLVLLSGLGGVLLFAPMAYSIEGLFPAITDDPDSDWADRVVAMSIPAAVLVEAIEMAPSYLTAWAVINLQPLSDAWRYGATRQNQSATHSTLPDPPAQESPDVEGNAAIISFVRRLPPAIGTDIVAVSSDLHYLHVFTRTGQAMVLGALKEVEDAFGHAGLRVHRSHWVRRNAVIRLRKTGRGWSLEMAGGHRVPISRRKRRKVAAQLGTDFVRETSTA